MISISSIPNAMLILHDDQIIQTNEHFCRMIGYDESYLIDRHFSNLIIQKNEANCEMNLIKSDNSELWVKYFYSERIINEMSCTIYSLFDITDHKSQVNRLETKNKQFSDILDCMSEEITREDTTGKIVYANRAYCEYYGKKYPDVIGMVGLDVVIPEDKERYDILKSLTPDNPYYVLYCRVYKADGNITWIQCSGTGIFDGDGNLMQVQETGRDFTKLKKETEELMRMKRELESNILTKNIKLLQTNMQLKSSNEYLDNIIASISEGIIVIDSSGNFEKSNLSSKKDLQVFENDLKKYIKDQALKKLDSPINRLVYNGTPFENMEITLQKDRKYINCFVSGVPLSEKMQNQHKGILIIRSESSVHKLVTKLSGFQTNFTFNDIITESQKMRELILYAKRIADEDVNFLIEGETGTGKEMFAQSIHNCSKRKDKPFIAINCGAIPDRLIESELFGYSEGAFTGGIKDGKPGKFELADGGTIFLDEIGEMPLENQSSLLRVLQDQKIIRIGGYHEIPVNVRIIAATNRDLQKEVAEGRFREDLYYRLNIINIKIPPLRQRSEDIRCLVKHFLREPDDIKMEKMGFDKKVLDEMRKYSWPGNIRQLQNFIQKTQFLTNMEENVINADSHIKHSIQQAVSDLTHQERNDLTDKFNTDTQNEAKSQSPKQINAYTDFSTYKTQIFSEAEEKEKSYILEMLILFDNNLSQISRKMGISRSTLYRKLKTYDINIIKS